MLPKALSVRDDYEFVPMQDLLERVNPNIVVKQTATGFHQHGEEAVYWGIAYLNHKPPTKKEVDNALREAGFDFALNFFFQAEDGIRDTSVTGVQTCALPI